MLPVLPVPVPAAGLGLVSVPLLPVAPVPPGGVAPLLPPRALPLGGPLRLQPVRARLPTTAAASSQWMWRGCWGCMSCLLRGREAAAETRAAVARAPGQESSRQRTCPAGGALTGTCFSRQHV